MNINASRYIVWPMLKVTLIAFSLGLSFGLQASNFGPLPSAVFGPGASLPCLSKEECPLPTRRALQKVAEDFLSFSITRLATLDKMEAEIRSSIQTYQLYTDEIFTKVGNTELKSFLELGRSKYEGLLTDLGLSSARLLVGGNSPFLRELKALNENLKQSDANIINAKTSEEKSKTRIDRDESYYNFRMSGNFAAFTYIEQVKSMIDHYESAGDLAPWMGNTKRNLRLKFNSCPVKIRRRIKKLNPTVGLNTDTKQLQFDVFDEYLMSTTLVQNGRLLTVNCNKKTVGKLVMTINAEAASIDLDYNLSISGTPILPTL